jgi:cytochrome c5
MIERIMVSALRAASVVAAVALFGVGPRALQAQGTSPAPVKWTKLSVDLPVSDVIFPAGDGAQIANAYCLMCHSAGMVLRQPPLTEAEWLAEVQKMRALWGAPIPADQNQPLAQYLTRVNGPGQATQPAARQGASASHTK